MKTVCIILNPIDKTTYIELPEEMNLMPINTGDILYRETSMLVHGVEINLNHKIRFVFIEYQFGMSYEKELVKKVTGESLPHLYRGVTDFLDDWKGKNETN